MKKQRAKEAYTLADLQNWQEVDPPIRLGVFGDPVAQSLSPQMQNAALRECKIDMQYARFQILPNELRDALNIVREKDFVGLNLTIPHKISAIEFLDDLDEGARRIGAANVIKIDPPKDGFAGVNDKKLRGFNTDGKGFARAIREEFS